MLTLASQTPRVWGQAFRGPLEGGKVGFFGHGQVFSLWEQDVAPSSPNSAPLGNMAITGDPGCDDNAAVSPGCFSKTPRLYPVGTALDGSSCSPGKTAAFQREAADRRCVVGDAGLGGGPRLPGGACKRHTHQTPVPNTVRPTYDARLQDTHQPHRRLQPAEKARHAPQNKLKQVRALFAG